MKTSPASRRYIARCIGIDAWSLGPEELQDCRVMTGQLTRPVKAPAMRFDPSVSNEQIMAAGYQRASNDQWRACGRPCSDEFLWRMVPRLR